MNRSLVKLEVVDAVGDLSDDRGVRAKALATLHMRNGPLHQVALLVDQVVLRVVHN